MPELDIVQNLQHDIAELHEQVFALGAEHAGYEELFLRVLRRKAQEAHIFCLKQLDYGPGNIGSPPHGIPPELALLVRMNDKAARIMNLLRTGAEASNEALDDSWLDLSVYATIGHLLSEGHWPGVDALQSRQGRA